MSITIQKSTSGAYFTVQNQGDIARPYIVNDYEFIPFSDGTFSMIDKLNYYESNVYYDPSKYLIYKQPYSNIINGDTGLAFADFATLQTYILTNFFRKAGGSSGTDASALTTGTLPDARLSSNIPTFTSIAQEADYVINIIGSTVSAIPRNGSGFTFYTGTDAYTVIQNAINALTVTSGATRGSRGGKIFISQGAYTLTNELQIIGWENQGLTNPGYSQLVIQGAGKSTHIVQNTAAKNGLLIKNNASVALLKLRIECGSSAKSAIRLDSGGTDEISVFGGAFDDLYLQAASSSYPALYMQNFFDLNVGTITCQNTNYDAIILENASTTTLYGNSNFGFIRAIASSSASFAGLRIKSTNGASFQCLDLITIANYECVSGYYGVYISDGSNFTFGMVDIENANIGFHIGGGSYARHNFVYSGLISASSKCIEASLGGNSFMCQLGGGGSVIPIADTQSFEPPNLYDVQLSGSLNPANISIGSAARTYLRYRVDSTARTFTNLGDNVTTTTQSPLNNSTALATTAYTDDGSQDEFTLQAQAIGSTIKAITTGVPFSSVSTSLTMTNNTTFLIPVFLKKGQTLTGVKVILSQAGSYTASNENRIGLYTYSAGTYTLVASSTNNGTLWQATSNTLLTIPFSGTYTAAGGAYWVGIIYNNSAETTPPKIYCSGNYVSSVWSAIDATNSGKLFCAKTGTATLPTPITASTAIQPSSNPYLVMIY